MVKYEVNCCAYQHRVIDAPLDKACIVDEPSHPVLGSMPVDRPAAPDLLAILQLKDLSEFTGDARQSKPKILHCCLWQRRLSPDVTLHPTDIPAETATVQALP